MKAAIRLTLVTVLLLTAGAVTAQDADLARPALDELAANRAVFANWVDALAGSSIGLDKPALLTPLRYRKGAALYRMRSLETGDVELAWVRVENDPTREIVIEDDGDSGPARIATKACAPGSPRCDVPFGTILGHNKRCLLRLFINTNFNTRLVNTDHDWNTMNGWGVGYNDKMSSLQTTCHGALLFEHHHFGGTMLSVPPYTNMASVGTFNDKLSSLLHVIP